MFNTTVFLILCALALIANWIAVPANVNTLSVSVEKNRKFLVFTAMVKANIYLIFACALGTYMAPRVGLSSPFLESLADFDKPHLVFISILSPTFYSALYVLAGLILLYVFFVGKNITSDNFHSTKFSVRFAQECVIEGLVFRWAIISFVSRVLIAEFDFKPDHALVQAIFFSAICVSLSHISDLQRMNYRRLQLAILSIIVFNFWAALCYGWIFWKLGFLASLMCHAVVVGFSVFMTRILHK